MQKEFSTGFSKGMGKLRFIRDFQFYAFEFIDFFKSRHMNITENDYTYAEKQLYLRNCAV